MSTKIQKLMFAVVALVVAEGCLGAEAMGGRRAKLSVAESMPSYFYTNIDGHPGTYAFGYDISDPATGNTQFRTEERYPDGRVVGSYGYVDANGRPVHYEYIADDKGYRVKEVRSPPPSIVEDILPPHPSSYESDNSLDEQPEYHIVRRTYDRSTPTLIRTRKLESLASNEI